MGEAIAQAMKTAEQSRSSNKAPPLPAPTKTKAPPENTTQGKQLGIPPNSPKARSVQLDENRSFSPGEEEHENIIAGPIDLTKPEQVTGPHSRMKLAISEEKTFPKGTDMSRNNEAHRSSRPYVARKDEEES